MRAQPGRTEQCEQLRDSSLRHPDYAQRRSVASASETTDVLCIEEVSATAGAKFSPRRCHLQNPKTSLSQDLSEPSWDILHGIHRQLALNIDARLNSLPDASPPASAFLFTTIRLQI
ncbi:unnamed protein product [Schistocephalus solidus]|uniref:Uncharacterized protein n=1 Tax=Schistocephalus solidus TaxID=70667 RepID=A0A183SDS0_SCHSO|nr:unnamed protein product [Schistocephalus solidus]